MRRTSATACHRERLVERAESAYGCLERGRYLDALRAIKPVADEAPTVAGVRELAGLAAYRSGRWREAVRHLQAFAALTRLDGAPPGLMDCQRALHKPKKVAELWSELRHSSPEPDVLAEGRIVAAASLADTGDLNGAIAMLATAGAARRCATRRTATSASGTCWPTSTSGRATCRGPASTSSGCAGPIPRPTTSPSGCAASVRSAGPGQRPRG